MIYTLTLNPAIDYNLRLTELLPGSMNRPAGEYFRCGGKGINVSSVLRNLGIESTALGFTAGFTGDELERQLTAQGINNDFIRLYSGMTRICIKLLEDNGRETEVNASGPEISDAAMAALKQKLLRLTENDTLLLAGSVPRTVSKGIYAEICSMLSDKGVKIVADASGSLLADMLCYHPWLIKPNHKEAGEICGTEIDSYEKAEECALKLRDMGALNVIISMGAKGSLLAAEDGSTYRIAAPSGKAVNTVGSGDSLLAGFLAGYEETGDLRESLRRGTAAGSATAFTGRLCEKADYECILSEVHYD